MADSSGSSFLGFILGGVVVVVAVLAFLAYGGHFGKQDTVKLEFPKPAIIK